MNFAMDIIFHFVLGIYLIYNETCIELTQYQVDTFGGHRFYESLNFSSYGTFSVKLTSMNSWIPLLADTNKGSVGYSNNYYVKVL